jgi:hypothetical protein
MSVDIFWSIIYIFCLTYTVSRVIRFRQVRGELEELEHLEEIRKKNLDKLYGRD